MTATGPQAVAHGKELLTEVQKAMPDMDTVKWLIERADLTLTDNQNRTAFMTIAGWGNDEILQKALIHGAQVNQPGPRGNTAVHIVAASGGKSALETMMQHGGDFAQKNDAGKTPYDLAQGRFTGDVLIKIREKFEVQDPTTSRLNAFREYISEQGLRTEKPTGAPRRAVFKPKQ
ncbi:MAG TPA: ankyrin repeat domain-containing protein [Patescibacteria group bacterium]|nr:ankyrin repeat domain-containing protein [Patescibacteria group bacterium]